METTEDEGTSRQRRRGALKDKTGTRRTWTVREEEALLSGLRSLVASGWKCDNGFRNGYLAQLENYVQRNIPGSDLKAEPHITSKIQVWKRQYSCIVGIMSKSGFGWDESKCMVTIEENDKDASDNYVKVDPYAKNMRYKSFPYFPIWREIFGKDRASGDVANNTDAEANKIHLEREKKRDDVYIPTTEWNPDTGFVGPEEDPPLSSHMNVDPTVNSSSATKRIGSSSRKRKVTDPLAELPQLVNVVTNFCDSANVRAEKLVRVLESEFGDPETRGLVLEAVRQLKHLDENEHLVTAQRLVNRSKDLELLYSLSGDSREKWVRLMLDGRF